MYIDTHAHLTFPEFKSDLPEVLERAKAAQLTSIVNIALDEEALVSSLQIAAAYPNYIYTAYGLHPHDATTWQEKIADDIKKLAAEKKIVAVGEIGLDYHYNLSPPDQQKQVFRRVLQLAQEVNLPTIIHSRESTKDMLTILHEENQGKLRGVLHCFSGDMELGRQALEMGLMISFTATVTFPKATIVRAAAKEIPLEKIMIETDCPFLSPQGKRGQRNEPSYVVTVAEAIAKEKNLTTEEVAAATSQNARAFFGI
ncbi:TatD family hydrolase [Candidatus Saganbacteria bacterium]|nr:TatD family hydrolase [Candidatus Saganbacteria bacterium]